MDLKGKLEAEVEILSSGDLFHELWSNTPHEICNAHPELVQSCDLHEGEFGKPGSIVVFNYTIEMNINLEDVVGAVRIRVRRGIDLVRRDSKSSDPYVAVTMGSQNLRTRTEKNNCNPVWNDELTLAITKTDPDLPVKLTVYDEDKLTTDDGMGWAEVDVKSLTECGRMELSSVESGTTVSRIHPSRQNCLAEDSNIVWKDGKLRQDMILRLNDVDTGEVDIQLEWVDLAN